MYGCVRVSVSRDIRYDIANVVQTHARTGWIDSRFSDSVNPSNSVWKFNYPLARRVVLVVVVVVEWKSFNDGYTNCLEIELRPLCNDNHQQQNVYTMS